MQFSLLQIRGVLTSDWGLFQGLKLSRQPPGLWAACTPVQFSEEGSVRKALRGEMAPVRIPRVQQMPHEINITERAGMGNSSTLRLLSGHLSV